MKLSKQEKYNPKNKLYSDKIKCSVCGFVQIIEPAKKDDNRVVSLFMYENKPYCSLDCFALDMGVNNITSEVIERGAESHKILFKAIDYVSGTWKYGIVDHEYNSDGSIKSSFIQSKKYKDPRRIETSTICRITDKEVNYGYAFEYDEIKRIPDGFITTDDDVLFRILYDDEEKCFKVFEITENGLVFYKYLKDMGEIHVEGNFHTNPLYRKNCKKRFCEYTTVEEIEAHLKNMGYAEDDYEGRTRFLLFLEELGTDEGYNSFKKEDYLFRVDSLIKRANR
ncbi:MAG: hypothetical protein ACRCZB_04965 [Bacteroidales bacterium]